MDLSGTVNSSGRTYEGPLCIEVYYNPAVQFASLESVAGAPVALPDFSKILLGGPAAGGPPVSALTFDLSGETLPEVAKQLDLSAQLLKARLDNLKQVYATTSLAEDTAINDLTQMNKALHMTDEESFPASFKNEYKAVRSDLKAALVAPSTFTPTDVSDPAGNLYLVQAQQLEDRLTHLPLEFTTGTEKPKDCTSPASANWTDWIATCRDPYYTTLKAELDNVLAEAQSLTSGSDQVTALKKKVNIVLFWDKLFTKLGLSTGMPNIDGAHLTNLITHLPVQCDGLSIQTVPYTVNLTTYDYTPTLSGNDPMKTGPVGFVTVNCSSRFSISAGVGFSTIEQKTFAILQSSDGKGGTVNTFGTTSDSKVSPIALAVTHVRFRDWLDHGVGLYGSFGVGGDLQTNASAAYFLPSASIAFWRTMYVTAGVGIGGTTALTGGYHEGDTVPSGVTSVSGLTKNSHAAGFAFAVTFTKP